MRLTSEPGSNPFTIAWYVVWACTTELAASGYATGGRVNEQLDGGIGATYDQCPYANGVLSLPDAEPYVPARLHVLLSTSGFPQSARKGDSF